MTPLNFLTVKYPISGRRCKSKRYFGDFGVGRFVRVPPRIRPPQSAQLVEAQKYVCRVIFHRGSSHVQLRIYNKVYHNVHSHVRIKCGFIIIIPCTYNRVIKFGRSYRFQKPKKTKLENSIFLSFLGQDNACQTKRNLFEA